MIRPLRERHRRVIPALTLVLLALLAWALLGNRS